MTIKEPIIHTCHQDTRLWNKLPQKKWHSSNYFSCWMQDFAFALQWKCNLNVKSQRVTTPPAILLERVHMSKSDPHTIVTGKLRTGN